MYTAGAAQYNKILSNNGWELVEYDGRMRNAPTGMQHIFRDLPKGFYYINASRELLKYLSGEIARFDTPMTLEAFHMAWQLAVANYAITNGYIFIAKDGDKYVTYPSNYKVPATVLRDPEVIRAVNGSVMAYNIDNLAFFFYDRLIVFDNIQMLLNYMSEITPYAVRDERYPMTRQELMEAIVGIRKALDLIEYNLVGGEALF